MKHPPSVRIGGGVFKGRTLRYPRARGSDRVRPTAARTRESVFNALQDAVRGAAFVDLYAAAGGVGIEALSRGASFVHFVERDAAALAALEANLDACGVAREHYRVHGVGVERFLAEGGLDDARIRVVYADPPYDRSGGAVESLLALLDERPYPHVQFLVVEHGGVVPARAWRHWRVERERRFGDTTLTYFTPTQGSEP